MRAPAIADGATTNTAADISITSVSFVIMPSRWAAAGSTAASASATTRARRDSGSHFSSPTQTSAEAQHPPQRRHPPERARVQAPPDHRRRDQVIERRVRSGRVEVRGGSACGSTMYWMWGQCALKSNPMRAS